MDIRALIKMELHDIVVVDGSTTVLRVYGGWIYLTRVDDMLNSTFVPYEK